MPTGYTDSIKDEITFKEFALNCARAFGACVTMRDESFNKPIPKEFKPSNYHKKEIKKIKEKLKVLEKVTLREAIKKAKQAYQKAIKFNEEEILKNNNLRRKYEDMLIQVKNWQPPTSEHVEFKKFMVEQIQGSIEFDCNNDYYLENKPILLIGQQWIDERNNALIKDLDYHIKEDIAENKRVAGRNNWIKKLRKSLK